MKSTNPNGTDSSFGGNMSSRKLVVASSPSTLVYDGDLTENEDASLLARLRYHDCDWIPAYDLHQRPQLDEAIKRILAKFTDLNQQHLASYAHPPPPTIPVQPTALPPPASPSSPPHTTDLLSLYPPPPPCPILPDFHHHSSLSVRLRLLQSYLRSFEYNHLGHEFCPINKSRSFARCMKQAQEMAREAYPLKCLEAVVLATWCTRDWRDLERLPLRFKTRSNGHSYWHIVLAVTNGTLFGSVGLSRRCTLDYRPFTYTSLSSLVDSFRLAYEEVDHQMQVITVGLPMPKKEYAPERIFWHFLQIPVWSMSHVGSNPDVQSVQREWATINDILDRFSKMSAKLNELVRKISAATSTATSVSFTSSLFLPPSALKAIGTIHMLCNYDSAQVAFIYKPTWLESMKSGAKTNMASEDDSGDSETEGHSSDDSDSDHHSSPQPYATSSSDKPMEEHKSSPPSTSPTAAPAVTAKSVAALRRAAERLERRKSKALVEMLRERHRVPLHQPTASPTTALSPGSPLHHLNVPGSSLKKRIGKPSPSPTRTRIASPSAATANGSTHSRKTITPPTAGSNSNSTGTNKSSHPPSHPRPLTSVSTQVTASSISTVPSFALPPQPSSSRRHHESPLVASSSNGSSNLTPRPPLHLGRASSPSLLATAASSMLTTTSTSTSTSTSRPLSSSSGGHSRSRPRSSRADFELALRTKLPEWEQEMWKEMNDIEEAERKQNEMTSITSPPISASATS